MDPLDFKKIAVSLLEIGGAAACRTAISRAYYSIFLLCRIKINEIGINLPRDYKAHESVKQYFNNCDDFQLCKVAKQLSDIRTDRNNADYDLTKKYVEKPENAKARLKTVDRMIDTVNKSFYENERNISEKMHEYHKIILGLR